MIVKKSQRRIAFFLYGLTGGGVPRRTVTLANAFAANGDRVDIVVLDAQNPWQYDITGIRLIALTSWRLRLPFVRTKRRRQFAAARRALEHYLKTEQPSVVISADSNANLTALDARQRAAQQVPVIVTQRTHTSTYAANKPALIKRIQQTYPQADAVVGVSESIIEDLASLGVRCDRLQTIYNPVIAEDFKQVARLPVDHPWFKAGQPPVVLGVGRIGQQKDFSTLVKAFAQAHQVRPDLRLVILGDAQHSAYRKALLDLASDLKVAEVVDLPGAVPQAIPYMARAALVALSSRFEGMPGVLIEALACGTPVISTDCPSGPNEVLENGRYGTLVPVGDDTAFARAMLETLANPLDRKTLSERGLFFSAKRSLRQYSDLVDTVVEARRRT